MSVANQVAIFSPRGKNATEYLPPYSKQPGRSGVRNGCGVHHPWLPWAHLLVCSKTRNLVVVNFWAKRTCMSGWLASRHQTSPVDIQRASKAPMLVSPSAATDHNWVIYYRAVRAVRQHLKSRSYLLLGVSNRIYKKKYLSIFSKGLRICHSLYM